MGSDLVNDPRNCILQGFQSTLPEWGATACNSLISRVISNFNPRSPNGERLTRKRHSFSRRNFNPRSPNGERRILPSACILAWRFQSTLPEWGATWKLSRLANFEISIHAPRMGSDAASRSSSQGRCISIHAPRMGSDSKTMAVGGRRRVFQSTLPEWGATPPPSANSCRSSDFNPRSPNGERLFFQALICFTVTISIHAPRMGSDWYTSFFNALLHISIHAPRMGSDEDKPKLIEFYSNFNPRSPNGERRRFEATAQHTRHFNPRSPNGERPCRELTKSIGKNFNPRSPNGERPNQLLLRLSLEDFNPRSPNGERLCVSF